MRSRRALAAIAVAAAMTPLVPTAAVAAGDTTPPHIVDVRFSASTVNVDATGSVDVVIRLHLTDSGGVCRTCFIDADPMASFPGYKLPLVRFVDSMRAPGGFAQTNVTGFKLTSGTVQDGWWSSRRTITGMWNGSLPIMRIAAVDSFGNVVDVDPRGTSLARTLTVHATHIPHISMGTVPKILAYGASMFTVKGRAYFGASNAPIGGRTLLLCTDTGCGIEGSFGGVAVRTNANGYYSVTTRSQALGLMLFHTLRVSDNGTAFPPWFPGSNPLYTARSVPVPLMYHFLTAHPAATQVALGSTVTVSGSTEMPYTTSTPVSWRSVSLATYTSTGWRVVDERLIGLTSSRGLHPYALRTKPATRGVHRYRVLRPPSPGYAATYAYFTVTVG